MRILQIVKTSRGATWAYHQARSLIEQGIEVITLLPDDKHGLALEYQRNGMRVVKGDWSLPISRPWQGSSTLFRTIS